MPVYISGSSIISSQHTFDRTVLEKGFIDLDSNRWPAIEPEYSEWIDSRQIRRMSRVIRMSVASVRQLLKQTGVQPDAVLVGTSLGCLEDTHTFLEKLVSQNEELLSPTAFIHSTHNTIAAQVAMHTGSKTCYNTTYVHRAQSFESALLDAMLLLNENEVEHALIGGVDEIIDTSFELMDALGLYKTGTINCGTLLNQQTSGSVAGEGAGFFVLSNEKSENSKAVIAAVEFVNNVSDQLVFEFLSSILIDNKKPDLILSGVSGDADNDKVCQAILRNELLNGIDSIAYKDKCGEYGTSSAFALWMAGEILENGMIPPAWNKSNIEKTVESVLIHHYQPAGHHSFILVESC